MTDLTPNSQATKETPLAAPIHPLVAQRWSPRAFARERAVAADKIESLIEAARWAPSCFGAEPWRFIVLDRYRDQAAWQKAFAALVPGNQAWVHAVPVLILICADTRFSHNDSENRWGAYDTGAAAVSMALQAVAEGLATHQMGGFDGEQLRAAFGIPDRFVPMSVMAVGYQADANALTGDLAARELAPRNRRPLHETYFVGAWGAKPAMT